MTRAKKRTQPRSPRRDAGRPRGESVLQAVMSCTLEELAVHGLERLSVERIARAAEVNKTSVYRRWPTREALVVAALERVLADVSLTLADTGSLRGDLHIVAEAVAGFLGKPIGRALAQAAFVDSAGPAIAALAARSLETQSAKPARDLVERAQARGEWRAGVPPEFVFSMLVGAILHRSMLERRPTPPNWVRTLVDVVLSGVLAH